MESMLACSDEAWSPESDRFAMLSQGMDHAAYDANGDPRPGSRLEDEIEAAVAFASGSGAGAGAGAGGRHSAAAAATSTTEAAAIKLMHESQGSGRHTSLGLASASMSMSFAGDAWGSDGGIPVATSFGSLDDAFEASAAAAHHDELDGGAVTDLFGEGPAVEYNHEGRLEITRGRADPAGAVGGGTGVGSVQPRAAPGLERSASAPPPDIARLLAPASEAATLARFGAGATGRHYDEHVHARLHALSPAMMDPASAAAAAAAAAANSGVVLTEAAPMAAAATDAMARAVSAASVSPGPPDVPEESPKMLSGAPRMHAAPPQRVGGAASSPSTSGAAALPAESPEPPPRTPPPSTTTVVVQGVRQMHVMLENQARYAPLPTYIRDVQFGSGMDENWRRQLVEWIFDLMREFNLPNETAYLAINSMDRLLSLAPIPKVDLQLVGITCCFTASKVADGEQIRLSELKTMFEGSLGVDDVGRNIARMEVNLLNTLRWDMNALTPQTFKQWLLQLVPDAMGEREQVSSDADMFLDLTVVEYSFLRFRAAATALAAIACALRMRERDLARYARALAATGVPLTFAEAQPCAEAMASTFCAVFPEHAATLLRAGCFAVADPRSSPTSVVDITGALSRGAAAGIHSARLGSAAGIGAGAGAGGVAVGHGSGVWGRPPVDGRYDDAAAKAAKQATIAINGAFPGDGNLVVTTLNSTSPVGGGIAGGGASAAFAAAAAASSGTRPRSGRRPHPVKMPSVEELTSEWEDEGSGTPPASAAGAGAGAGASGPWFGADGAGGDAEMT